MRRGLVLLVSPFPPPYGGIASYSQNLHDGLRARGVSVGRYNTTRYEKLRFHSPDMKRNYRRVIDPRNLFFLAAMGFDLALFLAALARARPRVVHVHTSSYWGWWRSTLYVAVARCGGCSAVLHVHNAIDRFYFQESGAIGRLLIRLSLRVPDELVSLSDGIRTMLAGLTKKPITAIFNGVHCADFTGEKEPEGPVRILFAGFVGQQKGVGDLLRALKESGLTADQVRMTVMGAGEVARMQGLAEGLGLGDQVHFTGRVDEDEKMRYFKSHHVLALPSYGEGQPISILEGMASGMAILATRVGSIPEVVREGENGFLVLPGDVPGLARSIAQLTDRGALAEMGRRNQETAMLRFDFSRVVDDNLELYTRLASRTGHRMKPKEAGSSENATS